MPLSKRPVCLTIAGSDSGGGAGIQADIKTFQAFGVFGTSAITAVTAQNTVGVAAMHLVPMDIVRAQIDSVVKDLAPSAVKTGMLATRELVTTVADGIREHTLTPFVLDPVVVATSGDRLLDGNAADALLHDLLPLATVVTPNLDEARLLTGLAVVGEEGQREAARQLVRMGAQAALVKGGHGSGPEIVDLLWDGREERVWRRTRIMTRNTHGTGCTLSAGIAAGLAKGRSVFRATDEALRYVELAILQAPNLGHGHGPLSHF
jgi:hydroxymethylpyrimidine/phosphomethylpyrimidine kinase